MSTVGPAESTTVDPRQRRLVVVNAGTSIPSSSRMIADRIARAALDRLREEGVDTVLDVIELGPLAGEVASAMVSGIPHGALVDAVELLGAADGVVVTTPVYKAGMSGLLKSFVDVLDNDLLIATPVALAASAGSARHALVADEQLRPLFAYMRALTLPTSVYAAPEDWGSSSLGERLDRAATELAVMVKAGVEQQIADSAWGSYQHQFGGNAARAEQTADDVDFSSRLMRLATGGR